jgi:hypothetical protein
MDGAGRRAAQRSRDRCRAAFAGCAGAFLDSRDSMRVLLSKRAQQAVVVSRYGLIFLASDAATP